MQQQTLFCEDIYEALRTDIQALGGNKAVGKILWPEKDPQKAGDYLSTCLRHERAEKLDIEQIMLIASMARESGSYHTYSKFCDTTGFTRGVPISPEDKAAQLQQAFINSVEMQQKILREMQQINFSGKTKR